MVDKRENDIQVQQERERERERENDTHVQRERDRQTRWAREKSMLRQREREMFKKRDREGGGGWGTCSAKKEWQTDTDILSVREWVRHTECTKRESHIRVQPESERDRDSCAFCQYRKKNGEKERNHIGVYQEKESEQLSKERKKRKILRIKWQEYPLCPQTLIHQTPLATPLPIGISTAKEKTNKLWLPDSLMASENSQFFFLLIPHPCLPSLAHPFPNHPSIIQNWWTSPKRHLQGCCNSLLPPPAPHNIAASSKSENASNRAIIHIQRTRISYEQKKERKGKERLHFLNYQCFLTRW